MQPDVAISQQRKLGELPRSSLQKVDASKVVRKELRRRQAREGMRRYRKAMTKEKKEKFRKENRERMKRYRASMSEQQKKKCSEVMKKWRARLTEEQREKMRKKDRERKKKLRDAKFKNLWGDSQMNRSQEEKNEESPWDGLWNDSEIIIWLNYSWTRIMVLQRFFERHWMPLFRYHISIVDGHANIPVKANSIEPMFLCHRVRVDPRFTKANFVRRFLDHYIM